MHEFKDFFIVCKNIYLISKNEEFLLLSKSNHGLNILSREHLPEKTVIDKLNEVSYLAGWISRVDDNNGPDFAPENETFVRRTLKDFELTSVLPPLYFSPAPSHQAPNSLTRPGSIQPENESRLQCSYQQVLQPCFNFLNLKLELS